MQNANTPSFQGHTGDGGNSSSANVSRTLDMKWKWNILPKWNFSFVCLSCISNFQYQIKCMLQVCLLCLFLGELNVFATSRGVIFHTSVQGCTFVYWTFTTSLVKSVPPVWQGGSWKVSMDQWFAVRLFQRELILSWLDRWNRWKDRLHKERILSVLCSNNAKILSLHGW